jgi:hypothetical protein
MNATCPAHVVLSFTILNFCQTPEHEISWNSVEEKWRYLEEKEKVAPKNNFPFADFRENYMPTQMYLKRVTTTPRNKSPFGGSRGFCCWQTVSDETNRWFLQIFVVSIREEVRTLFFVPEESAALLTTSCKCFICRERLLYCSVTGASIIRPAWNLW